MNEIIPEIDSKSLFLTDEELRELTEYKHRLKQQRRLTDMEIPFKVGRFGRPIVLREALQEHLGAAIRSRAASQPIEPDFEALATMQNGS